MLEIPDWHFIDVDFIDVQLNDVHFSDAQFICQWSFYIFTYYVIFTQYIVCNDVHSKMSDKNHNRELICGWHGHHGFSGCHGFL